MKIKNICIISYEYPSEKKMIYTFLEELVNQFTDFEINCYVIAPQSITKAILRDKQFKKKEYNRYTFNNNIVNVYSPYYISFSNKKFIINTNQINLWWFSKAAKKVFSKLSKKINFDLIYAHFIFPAALTANEIGKKYNLPVFFAYGENTSYTIDYLGLDKTKKRLDGISGVISVSNSNKKRLIDNNLFSKDMIKVFPNGINNNVFYKKDKNKMREKLGIKEDDFIVAFVGRFVNIKGIDRLCEALNIINNKNIKAIFIGYGDVVPNYSNIIFKGEVDHKEIAEYLSASDIFVLPTISEGCCNAIIEALACGLPVISSNESFNDDILDDSCSIRIDSMNIEEIKNAIELLYKDKKLRDKLSKGALIKVKELNIETRAKNIIDYMQKIINEQK